MSLRLVISRPLRRWQGRIELVTQQREQTMILPLAVDLQITAGHALFAEAAFSQHTLTSRVVREGRRLDPMQAQSVERETTGALPVSYTHLTLPTIYSV